MDYLENVSLKYYYNDIDFNLANVYKDREVNSRVLGDRWLLMTGSYSFYLNKSLQLCFFSYFNL